MNLYTLLGVAELPENFGEDNENPLDAEMDQHPSRTSTPLPRRRRPPPITIDSRYKMPVLGQVERGASIDLTWGRFWDKWSVERD
ncbi:hypothetical protein TNCV_3247151 [Trichonephila clavipes]|nr:hypothetical protein TNCV_3247151 [Trichonephila clavipes]